MHMESRKSSKIRHSQALRLSPVIDAVIGNLGMKKRYNGWQIVNQWPAIVGDKIAAATKADRFEDGILFVKVKDAAWRQELSMQIDSLLDAIHKKPHGRYVKQIRLA
jgi:predicted nucleic acid-binding Zn ribbon protein